MLVSKTPIKRDVPHEEGEWFEFVRLSWTKFRDARKVAERENRGVLKELGAEFVKAFQSEDDTKKLKKLLDDQEWDPRQFDAETLLGFGVLAWSYEAEVSTATLGDLDTVTKAWAVQAIIDLSRPPTAEQEKKVSPSSTTP